MRPKYSLVIPTLNGKEKLKYSLKNLLNINREDIEIVISDNISEDNTYEYLKSLNHNKIKINKTNKRISAGENLSLAISQAQGEWITHMGDDDNIINSRYEVFDKLIKQYKSIELIKTNWVKYYWHDYPLKNLANHLSPVRSFTHKYKLEDSITFFKKNINNPYIDSGNCWIIKKTLIEKIEKRYGYFCHPQNLEFFFIRACLLNTKCFINIDSPYAISGSHQSSSSSIYKKDINNDWNWELEDNQEFKYSPIQKKTYLSISYDGLMRSLKFNSQLKDHIDISRWMYFFIKSDIGYSLEVKKIFKKMTIFNKIKFFLRVVKGIFRRSYNKKISKINVFDLYKAKNIYELSKNLEVEIKKKIFL